MSSNKKRVLRNIFTSNAGCGCGRLKQSDIFLPKPLTKTSISIHQNPSNHYHSSSSSWDRGGGHSIDDDDHTSTTFSLYNLDTSPHCSSEQENDPNPSKTVSPCPKIRDSVAVAKDSDDPFGDFRRSMLEMILEREIYSKDELQELLNCFLKLNSPSHHEIIVRAFMEIWNGVVSKRKVT